jgi:hypothetical protein
LFLLEPAPFTSERFKEVATYLKETCGVRSAISLILFVSLCAAASARATGPHHPARGRSRCPSLRHPDKIRPHPHPRNSAPPWTSPPRLASLSLCPLCELSPLLSENFNFRL